MPSASSEAAAADTLSAPWIEAVTMEPIRVVVPYEMRLEAVTMEPIRVVVPYEERLEAVTMEPIRVVVPLGDSATTE